MVIQVIECLEGGQSGGEKEGCRSGTLAGPALHAVILVIMHHKLPHASCLEHIDMTLSCSY